MPYLLTANPRQSYQLSGCARKEHARSAMPYLLKASTTN
jgi:hypothetical protein